MNDNPTKVDYVDGDAMTPTEANNIGYNLISLGQKILRVGDDTWILTNADYVAGHFVRLDPSKAAAAIRIALITSGTDAEIYFYESFVGSNPIVWNSARLLSDFVLGSTISLAALRKIEQTGSNLLAVDVPTTGQMLILAMACGNVAVGDHVMISWQAIGTKQGTAGKDQFSVSDAFGFLRFNGGSAAWIQEFYDPAGTAMTHQGIAWGTAVTAGNLDIWLKGLAFGSGFNGVFGAMAVTVFKG